MRPLSFTSSKYENVGLISHNKGFRGVENVSNKATLESVWFFCGTTLLSAKLSCKGYDYCGIASMKVNRLYQISKKKKSQTTTRK